MEEFELAHQIGQAGSGVFGQFGVYRLKQGTLVLMKVFGDFLDQGDECCFVWPGACADASFDLVIVSTLRTAIPIRSRINRLHESANVPASTSIFFMAPSRYLYSCSTV